jgi:small conductance mechanosensitive channel
MGWNRAILSAMLDSLANVLNPATLPGGLAYALIFLALALIGVRLVRVFARRSARHFNDVTALNFVAQLAQVGVFLAALILYAQLIPALRAVGTALLAGVSVASILVALAAQNTLANLIAGLALLLYHPFRAGDRVQLTTPNGVQTATIVALTLGYTLLRNAANQEIVVPNSVMVSQVIILLPPEEAE